MTDSEAPSERAGLLGGGLTEDEDDERGSSGLGTADPVLAGAPQTRRDRGISQLPLRPNVPPRLTRQRLKHRLESVIPEEVESWWYVLACAALLIGCIVACAATGTMFLKYAFSGSTPEAAPVASSTPLAEPRKSESRHKTRLPLGAAKNCLLHVTYGHSNDDVSLLTIPSKRQYAEMHGYQLKSYTAPDYPALITTFFGGCLGSDIQPTSSFDKQTVLKWCGLWKAFEEGCSVVMWTDASTVIHTLTYSLDYWMSLDRKADVYWSLDDPGAKDWCRKQSGKASEDSVEKLNIFASCLNAGVFIMRRNIWTESLLKRTLELSMDTKKEHCGTASLNSARFDQCMFTHFNVAQYQQAHVGDQCVVTCDAALHHDVMTHYQTFGPDHKPPFQQVILTSFYFPRNVFFWRELKVEQDAFVINCGGDIAHDQLIECVKFAVRASSINT